jgi:hypothetical protein
LSTGDTVQLFDPEIIHHIRFVITIRARGTVVLENIFSDVIFHPLESIFEFFDVSLTRVELLLGDEPRNWI